MLMKVTNNGNLSKRGFLNLAFSAGLLMPVITSGTMHSYCRVIHQKMLLSRKPMRNEQMASRAEDEIFVIFDRGKKSDVLKINETAMHVFRMCDGHHDLQDIASTLSSRFDVPAAKCLDDVIFAVNIFDRFRVTT